MSKTIEFPGNYQRYLEMGYEALEEGRIQAALALFKEAYESHQDFAINLLIVNLSLEIGDRKGALEIAEEKIADYIQDARQFYLLIEVLAQNHQFIRAQELLAQKLTFSNEEEREYLLEMEKSLIQQEEYFQSFEKRKIESLKKEVLLLSDLPALLQIRHVKKSKELPKAEFVKIAKALLKDEKVHPLTKSWLVEGLVRLQVTEEIEVLDLEGQLDRIIPKNVPLPEESETLINLEKELQKNLSDTDPVMLAHVLEEIRMHFSLLYPFGSERITDEKLCVYSYLLEYGLVDSNLEYESDPRFLKIIRLKMLIRESLEDLL